MTAVAGREVHRTVAGFRGGGEREEDKQVTELGRAVSAELGASFTEWIDLIFAQVPTTQEGQRKWVQRNLLGRMSDQYRSHGLRLEWDDSVIRWILEQQEAHPGRGELTRLVEARLGEALIPHLPKPGAGESAVLVTAKRGKFHVEPRSPRSP
jgi:ATP-dependent Clp protease ATP-binding subunit ClpA